MRESEDTISRETIPMNLRLQSSLKKYYKIVMFQMDKVIKTTGNHTKRIIHWRGKFEEQIELLET